MARFMAIHSLPPHSVSREQAQEISDASQRDEKVHGVRSFINLSEGKVVCIMDANNQHDLEAWYQKMGLPYDLVCPVELEGDRGNVREMTPSMAAI